MATRKRRSEKRAPDGKQGGNAGSLAAQARKAKAGVEEAHARARSIHDQIHVARRAAHAAHMKVEDLEEAHHKAARRKAGIHRPPRTGVKKLDTSNQGAPLMRAALGAPPRSRLPFSIVGIGASAGGYEAFTTFLTHLNKDTGMAFVLIQHLDPSHPSHLVDLLKKSSPLPVIQITNGLQPEPNHIYVMPSNTSTTLLDGRFKLTGRSPARGIAMPIDIFFRSLAVEQENRAIAVLLSGTGTDGTLGVAEIKGQGGITFAQDQGSAKHFGMSASAISSGHIDFVLAPEAIAEELSRLAGHPYVAPRTARPGRRQGQAVEGELLLNVASEEIKQLFLLLRTRTGVDFSLYKPGTLNRRIMRRMVLHEIEDLSKYLKFLQENPNEVDALFHDLLISVTGFFRDPSSFKVLQKKILPKILRARHHDTPIRIWSCGCATGEEAYSLAIAVSEFLEKAGRNVPVQIFASDLNDRGIEHARAGVYHENILLDVSPERLRRYFVKVDGYYHVIKSIRDLCVFARQNVVSDPPFSNLDLISCRNLLIYLTPVLQKRVIPVFHYALKPQGFLLLGGSESIGESPEFFDLVDKKHKIYAKKPTAHRPALEVGRFAPREAGTPASNPPPKEDPTGATLQEKVDRLILTRLSPSAVVINAHMDVIQFRGQTGRFLEHQSGAASLNLLKMAREDLAIDLRRAINKAIQTGDRVEHRSAQSRGADGPIQEIAINVHPLTLGPEAERFFLVLFREITTLEPEPPTGRGQKKGEPTRTQARQISKLKEELAGTRDSLQAIIEEQEATNEELKSANEEIQSSNEELQSTNEELETAREELQSTNEELTTLNQELQNRNAELAQVNNDLVNLLNSVNIALIILGTDLTIRRFTPAAEKLFSLIPSDLGRRLSDLRRNLQVPQLEEWINEVLQDLSVIEREVQDREGRWYSLRIRPYRTEKSRIDGVVLMLVDIDELKLAIRHAMSVVHHPLLALTADLQVSWGNEAFYNTFQLRAEETEGKSIYTLDNGEWNIAALRTLLEQVLPRREQVKDFKIEHTFQRIGPRAFTITAGKYHEERRGVPLIMVSFNELVDNSARTA